MKNTSIKSLILISLVFVLTACGGDSGKKTSNISQNRGQVNGNFFQNGQVNQNGQFDPNLGGVNTLNPDLVTVGALQTPRAAGRSSFPNADLLLEFDRETNGQVFAQGALALSDSFGISFPNFNCTLPVGDYLISTQTPGRQLSKDHHYGQITISATGPVSFTAVITNALASQIQNQWFLHTFMDIQTVGGQSCTGFGFPLQLSFGIAL